MSDERLFSDWDKCQLDVERLCDNDRHADALELLVHAQAEAATAQSNNMPDIRELTTQVENRQNQRYTTIFTKQIKPYLELEKVDTSGELTEILGTEKTLKQIDPKRAKIEMDQKLRKLESNSRSHFEYSAIKSEVDKYLKQAASIARPEEADKEARIALDYLNQTLEVWISREDAMADSVSQRLRSLLSDVTEVVVRYAKRTNILTTAAGQSDMWQIEEEYQQWVAQPDAEHTPRRMPKMEWRDIPESDGSVQRRYEASGEVLNLQDWHDAFLSDAVQFSREKAERDLSNAHFALEAGMPDLAVKEAGKMLGKHERDAKPYFMLPQELKEQAAKFLDSPKLVLRLEQMKRAISWLGNADSEKDSHPLNALELFIRALREPVSLGERAVQYRPPIFQATQRFVEQCIQQDIVSFDISPDRERILDNLFPTETWLQVLPQYESDEDWQKLDPEKELQPVRNRLEQHKLRTSLWHRLVLFDKEYRQLPLSSVVQKLGEIEDEIQRRGFKVDEFPLLREMRIWYQNEVDAEKQIQIKLTDDELFPEDIAKTDPGSIAEELTAARDNVERHREFVRLIGALEGRRKLHREFTQRDVLTTDVCIDLLRQVEESDHALSRDKAAATRQLEVIAKDEQLRERQQGVINQVKLHAERRTVNGFTEALRLLNETTAANVMIGEVLVVQREVVELLDAMIPKIRKRFSKGITKKQQLDEAIQWLALSQNLGLGESRQELEALLNPLIWQWYAVNDDQEVGRLDALLHLAEAEIESSQSLHDPDNKTWTETATEAAQHWFANQLIQWRRQFSQKNDTKESIIENLRQAQHRIRTVKPGIESNSVYWRQLAELFVWLSDLENAAYYAQKSQSATDGPNADAPSAEDIQALLNLATYRQQVSGFRSEKLLRLAEAEQIRKEYSRLFSSQQSAPTQEG